MLVLHLYIYVVIVGAVLSWLVAFNIVNTMQPFVRIVLQTIDRLTEPILGRIRRFLPELGGLDLSPVVLILLIILIQRLIINNTPCFIFP